VDAGFEGLLDMRLSAEEVGEIEQKSVHICRARAEVWLLARQVKNQRGFTLVELITVMVIIGILAVAAVPRFFDNDVFQARGAADQVIAALRYGQKVAIAQHSNVDVRISSGANPQCDSTLVASAVVCVISNGVKVNPALPRTITFNALGQRVPNAATSIVVGTTSINIELETGYVH
jgi:MSHA pilin protein MshC